MRKLLRLTGAWLMAHSHLPSRLPDPGATSIIIMVYSNRTKIMVDVHGQEEGTSDVLRAALAYVEAEDNKKTLPAAAGTALEA